MESLEGIELARRSVEAASEKHASDILLLDARTVCSFTDYFVICSGESEPQIKAICEEIEARLKKEGVRFHHQEGNVESGWVVLDYGDVVVHVFLTPEREHYELEKVWSEAQPVVRIQ